MPLHPKPSSARPASRRPRVLPTLWPLSLAQLKRGRSAQVVAVHEPGALGERLMEMGLTPGTFVRLVRCGLWGDPMQLELRGYMLTLRRAQARNIDITAVP